MTKAEKKINIIVIVVVMLTGGLFGAWAGIGYSEKYWWIGSIAGTISAYPLAKLYLWQLAFASAKGYNVWLQGTCMGVFCGVICTTIVHGLMGLIIYPDFPFSEGELPFSWTFIIVVGEIIGAGAGLVAGAVLSGVYMVIKKGQSCETA